MQKLQERLQKRREDLLDVYYENVSRNPSRQCELLLNGFDMKTLSFKHNNGDLLEKKMEK